MNDNQKNRDWGEESAVHTGQGFPFLSIIVISMTTALLRIRPVRSRTSTWC